MILREYVVDRWGIRENVLREIAIKRENFRLR